MKLTCAIVISLIALCSTTIAQGGAREILDAAGIKGGLIVHLGCGDGELTAALRLNSTFVVTGLDTDSAKIATARQYIRARNLYGPVSVDELRSPQLPFVDDMANLIVVSRDECEVPEAEIQRVLCPGGVAVWLSAGNGKVVREIRKQRPEALGEWSHFLHGPDNNPVSSDTTIGPVSGLKWVCGPLWSRSHEFTSSVSTVVSAGGRVFYVVDEGITSITTPEVPERWVLVSRDAFNGKELWRQPLPEWRSRLGKNTALRSVPPTAQRCLVADKDRVYVASVIGAPLQALDAATGKVLTTYEKTKGVREFVKSEAAIFVYLEATEDKRKGRIARLDCGTGELLWSAANDTYKGESLAASEEFVIYHNGQSVVCLDPQTGAECWRTEKPRKPTGGRGAQATYILHDGLVIEGGRQLTVRNAATGKVIWQTSTGGRSMRDNDTFIAQGLVWHATGDMIIGYDLETGEPASVVDPRSVQSEGHHLRCHRAKATEDYLITQFRGVEFISITGQEHSQTDWTRGACSFGVVPANGLLYVPPNPCFCYPGVKIRGFNVLRSTEGEDLPPTPERLHKGSVFPSLATRHLPPATPNDWPTYRHDPMRHGTTRCEVGEAVSVRWKVKLGGPVSPAVVAGNRVYVAAKDEHTIYALDTGTGKTLWTFTAGARIDSPPTIHRGLAFFGSRDGFLYCITADEGKLAWRFRAAPMDRRIMAFDQPESVWPVHGSVLVKNDVAYCTAGRSSMLDGGIWLYGLNPLTGEVLYQAQVNNLAKVRTDAEDTPVVPSYGMRGAQADILVSEGDAIYMGPAMFNLQLRQLETYPIMDLEKKTATLNLEKAPYILMDSELQRDGYQNFRSGYSYQMKTWPQLTRQLESTHGGINLGDWKTGRHIAPTAGFLDGSWFNRTYWMYSDKWPGWYHAHRGAKTGQLLVVGQERTYALQAFPYRNRQSPLFQPGKQGYLLFADDNDNEPVLDPKTRGLTKAIGYTRTRPPVWYDWISIRVRGMVAAADTLFVAGTPDIVPEDDPTAGLEGRNGALLRAVSTTDGAILSQRKIDSPPVFDGLIAAAGCLFMSTEDHHLICLAEDTNAIDQAVRTKLRTEQAEERERIEAEARRRVVGKAQTESATAPTAREQKRRK